MCAVIAWARNILCLCEWKDSVIVKCIKHIALVGPTRVNRVILPLLPFATPFYLLVEWFGR